MHSQQLSTRLRRLILFLLLFKGTVSLAQQSLFNVPSSEITPEGRLFFQQQINFSSVIQLNTTLNYGLKHNWEVGINLLGIDYSPSLHNFLKNDVLDGDPFSPLALLNVQKGVDLSKHWQLGFGLQNGFNIAQQQAARFAQFYFANAVWTSSSEHLRLNGGAYSGNQPYLGDGTKTGLMLGAETALIPHKLHLMADWIQGTHDLGAGVIGAVAYPWPHWPVSLGWQLPNDSHKERALVLEITYVP